MSNVNESDTHRPLLPVTYIKSKKLDVEIDLTFSEKAVCKIYYDTTFGENCGTGFLCQIKYLDRTLEGLFTCCHVVNCLEKFFVNFEFGRFHSAVRRNNIEWIFTDRNLDVTFISFANELYGYIRSESEILSVGTSVKHDEYVIVLQHPEGKEQFFSEGKVKERKDAELYYTPSTRKGSSGAAVLNKMSKLVAIHKQGGPMIEIDSKTKLAEYNVGTLIANVIDAMSTAKPWDDSRWKEHNPDQTILSNATLSHLNINPVLQSATRSFCKLSLKNGVNECHGNGLLCCVKMLNNVTLYGLFTNKHVIRCKLEFEASFYIALASGKSKIIVESSDLYWVHANDEHHFTFVAFNEFFLKKMRSENLNFLSLAEIKPPNESKFFLIQHPKDTEPVIFEGTVQDNSDIYLYHEGPGRPHIHGSLVLNRDGKVIAIGNACGWSRQIGTFITEDIVLKPLNDAYEKNTYSESMLITDDKETDMSIAVAGLCKISTNWATFTGFLCTVPFKENKQFEGLFTTFHGINYKQSFDIHFDKGDLNCKIETNHVQYFFADKALGVTFIVFKDSFVVHLKDQGLQFFTLAKVNQPVASPISVLHHPEGKAASLSRGVVKSYSDNCEFHHISYTAYGSAGAPILNKDCRVIGIHKGTGPIDENGEPLYKIATNMADIVKWLENQRLHMSV